ncbi:MAG: Flp family type IVb pilin [Sporomusaceae bacterium]|nr:Flp family type IVb pilin [Sporomusaceae bacterium]
MLSHVWNYLRARIGNEKGQGLVEYGLILALVGVVVAVALSSLATDITGLFNTIGPKLNPTPAAPPAG